MKNPIVVMKSHDVVISGNEIPRVGSEFLMIIYFNDSKIVNHHTLK